MRKDKLPELLAPAGTIEALYAALAAGADAVYTGLGAFNARAGNTGLTDAELQRACALAHDRGARVYVTLNALVTDAELDRAVAVAVRALSAGADALIVADFGLARAIRCELPGAELHVSTQSGVQSPDAARLVADELGASRVTCARELSLGELASLAATGVEIEAFCHGAICICYSGACSMSALLRGRSANRGDCTQPCRVGYALTDGAGNVLVGGAWERGSSRAGFASGEGDRLLCPKDYCSIRHVPELVAAGVGALKIEGRMKQPDYVYNVVRCYRAALDAVADGRELDDAALDALEAQLARSFNRGLTDAYLLGASGRELMSVERSINQGVCVGSVVGLGFDAVIVELTRRVSAGDMLEIRSTPGEDALPDVPKRWPMVPCPVDAGASARIEVRCKRKVEVGSAVHVVRSVGVLTEADAAVERMRAEAERLMGGSSRQRLAGEADPRVGVDAAEVGGCLDASGRGEAPAGIVRAGGSSSEGRRHGRGMGYGGAANGGGCSVCDGEVSRSDVGTADSSRAEYALADGCAAGLALTCVGRDEVLGGPPRVLYIVSCPHDAQKQLASGVSVAVRAHRLLEADATEWEPLLSRMFVLLDEVHREADASALKRICELAGAVICRNIGQIPFVRASGIPWGVAAPLSVWNAQTARWLHGLGARWIWAPAELDECVVRELADALDGDVVDDGVACVGASTGDAAPGSVSSCAAAVAPCGSLLVGRMPATATELMTTEHCLLTAEGPCAHECAACPRRAASLHGDRCLLELDRKSGGNRIRVEVDAHGRTRLYR